MLEEQDERGRSVDHPEGDQEDEHRHEWIAAIRRRRDIAESQANCDQQRSRQQDLPAAGGMVRDLNLRVSGRRQEQGRHQYHQDDAVHAEVPRVSVGRTLAALPEFLE
jgi:hypothetical protein